MAQLTIVAQRKLVTITGHLTPDIYKFLNKLPGYKKLTQNGAVFAATRPHVTLWREMFPSTEIMDRDGTIAALFEPIPEIVEHKRYTTSKLEPFAHQRRAINIGLSRKYFGFFHGLGTGKTSTILHLAAELFARCEIDRAVIVTTKRVVNQIVTEQAPLHFPTGVNYRIAAFPSTLATKMFKYPDGNLLIAVCSYGALQSTKQTNELMAFVKGQRTAIFLDESHNIKSSTSKRVESLKVLRPHLDRRYLFTGEPQPLGTIDLYSQIKFMDENILGHNSLTSFKNAYCIMGGFEGRQIVGYQNLDELNKSIAPHCEYVRLEDVQDMPEKIYVTRKIDPEPEQIKLYNRMKHEFVVAVQAANDGTGAVASKLAKNAAAKFMALQQIACGFFLADATEEDGPTSRVILNTVRADYVAQELIPPNKKVVVFARFHTDLDMLREAFERENITSVELSGRRKDADNIAALEAFTKGDAQVLCATAASGGTGLNLQCAHTVVFYNNSYSYGDRIQAEGRVHRTGQTQRCIYFDIEMFPIDKLIRKNLLGKQDMSQQLQSAQMLRQLADEI